MNKYTELKKLINSEETLIIPDAFNPISAKLIEYTRLKNLNMVGM
jgi:2-methylisocitrate lyase-like PEP mutase family enzyme